MDELSFQTLRAAIYTHGIVVIKDQQDLLPVKQFEFTRRFDPEAQSKHGFGTDKSSKELGNLGVRQVLYRQVIEKVSDMPDRSSLSTIFLELEESHWSDTGTKEMTITGSKVQHSTL